MPDFARQVLDALPLTVYTIDLEGRITSANRSWSQFARDNGAPALATEASVCGQSLWSSIADASYRDQLQQAMELLRTGKAPRVSWEFPCSSPEEERVFLMQITPLRDVGHRVTGYVFSTVDITPSHRSREALIDTGLALSRTIDLDRVFYEVGHQLRRAVRGEAFAVLLVREHDGALERSYGVGYEETGPALDLRLTPLAHAAIEKVDVVAHATHGGVELAAPMAGGERTIGAMTVWIEGEPTRHEIEEAQRVLATLAAQTAVAIERARLVQRVGHKRRLEAIGEVATGVAHELRNPLFGISSAAQLLRFRAKDDPVVEKNVGRILREVERLNRMVTSLLEYGRPKPIVLTPGDPDAVWDDLLDGQRGLLESRALSLTRVRPAPAVACRIDPEQLAQVFLNVLVNAVDHAPEGSDLVMQSSLVANGAWRFRLTNAGPAVPADVLARVFEIFYSNKPGGTGIGLALCQRIVEEHDGEISLDSTPEHGTTVTITLPGVVA
ncbi:MAG TPA: ATP-binding protein [Gemmatimonadaceae bacterium]|jgi:PAS domain S-box-containing protein|nr:PAS domain-containing protein [Gemmatimonadota bacterium]MBK8648050.1 PAS domain-containing protein [Gemmatimonadota bacterium]MBK9410438.1 PAS domain-containing protein [Gemmatimonadota bacterium]HNV73222.1 ATP-binding protein [Gemmatimonadaceae bacterium]